MDERTFDLAARKRNLFHKKLATCAGGGIDKGQTQLDKTASVVHSPLSCYIGIARFLMEGYVVVQFIVRYKPQTLMSQSVAGQRRLSQGRYRPTSLQSPDNQINSYIHNHQP